MENKEWWWLWDDEELTEEEIRAIEEEIKAERRAERALDPDKTKVYKDIYRPDRW